jgi:hypothetical protein
MPDANGDTFRATTWVMLEHLDDEIDAQRRSIEMLRERLDKLLLAMFGVGGAAIASLIAIIATGA